MSRSIFPFSWRLLLAISLVMGPWPPATWAALAPAVGEAASETADCHGDEDQEPAAEEDAAPCEGGCCPDVACDPAHCLPMHASIAVSAPMLTSVVLPGTTPSDRGERRPTGPPLGALLRHPIA
jgi:hypothetical protein